MTWRRKRRKVEEEEGGEREEERGRRERRGGRRREGRGEREEERGKEEREEGVTGLEKVKFCWMVSLTCACVVVGLEDQSNPSGQEQSNTHNPPCTLSALTNALMSTPSAQEERRGAIKHTACCHSFSRCIINTLQQHMSQNLCYLEYSAAV